MQKVRPKIRFLMGFRGYREGAVIEPSAMVRGWFLEQRIIGKPVCELVQEQKAELQTAELQTAEEKDDDPRTEHQACHTVGSGQRRHVRDRKRDG